MDYCGRRRLRFVIWLKAKFEGSLCCLLGIMNNGLGAALLMPWTEAASHNAPQVPVPR